MADFLNEERISAGLGINMLTNAFLWHPAQKFFSGLKHLAYVHAFDEMRLDVRKVFICDVSATDCENQHNGLIPTLGYQFSKHGSGRVICPLPVVENQNGLLVCKCVEQACFQPAGRRR